MTNLDLTPEQSEKNFQAKSMLNMMDIVTVLDGWTDQIREDRLRIRLSDTAKKVLIDTVRSMRSYVLSSKIPDIMPGRTGTRYRYALDWYHNGLQLGIEKFDEDALFEPDGSEAPPMVSGQEIVVDEAAGNVPSEAGPGETTYLLVHGVPIRTIPLSDWADQNDVRTGTARQWVARGRIRAVKEGGALRVSPIQYTPDAYQRSRTVSYRFRFVGQLPEELVAKYPILSGMVLDLLLVPDQSDKSMYQLLSIHMDEATKKTKAESTAVPIAEKERILASVYEMEDVNDAKAKFYMSPFCDYPEEGNVHHFQIEPVDKDGANRVRRLKCSGSTETLAFEPEDDGTDPEENPDPSGRPAATGSVAVSFAAGTKDGVLSVTGRYHIHEESQETRLLNAIFGWPAIVRDIDDALQHAGLRGGTKSGTYPWNKNVLLVDRIESDLSPAFRDAAFKSLPRLLKETLCLDPGLVLVAKKDNRKYLDDLRDIGFRDAGKYLYAYDRTGKTFTGFN